MICIKTEIPQEICDIDDELKAIYHSKDTVCIWVFKNREDRNKFMDETAGMIKDEREGHYDKFYKQTAKYFKKALYALLYNKNKNGNY